MVPSKVRTCCISGFLSLFVLGTMSADDRIHWQFQNGSFQKTKAGNWIVVQDGKQVATLNQTWIEKDYVELTTSDSVVRVRLYSDRSMVVDKRHLPLIWREQYRGKWNTPNPPGPKPQSIKLPEIQGRWTGLGIGLEYDISQSTDKKHLTWTVYSNGEKATGRVVDHKSLEVDWISTMGQLNPPLRGTIVEWDASGRPSAIQWTNGIRFGRSKGGGVPGPQPMPPMIDLSGRWTGGLFGIHYDLVKVNGNQFYWNVPGLESAVANVLPNGSVVAQIKSLVRGDHIETGTVIVGPNNQAIAIQWNNRPPFRR